MIVNFDSHGLCDVTETQSDAVINLCFMLSVYVLADMLKLNTSPPEPLNPDDESKQKCSE